MKKKPAKDDWCALSKFAPSTLHAYQDHTIWHPLSFTDSFQEENSIMSNKSTTAITAHIWKPWKQRIRRLQARRADGPHVRQDKRISLKTPFVIISFSCNGLFVLRVLGAVRDRLVPSTFDLRPSVSEGSGETRKLGKREPG